jgi:molybdopterin-guanine dinucleotide biosynthesis protein B
MLVQELRGAAEPDVHALLQKLSPCDLVLVEGFKHAALDKIEVWRSGSAQPWLFPHDRRVLAMATDMPPTDMPSQVPLRLEINDITAVTDFVLGWYRANAG